ncbi:MAG TPA: carboxypeptidase-like regulatory domain-containing protein, partial [Pyrinomonadaceae bacterium]
MAYLKNTLLVGIFTCALIVTSLAQTKEAVIYVTVKDQFGGSIPDAEIVLDKSGEKVKRIKTNSLGIAQFSLPSAGKFQIYVSAEGFKEYIIRDVVAGNNEIQRFEAVLELAPIESNVDIGGEDTAEAEKTGVTAVLDEKEIANLPDNQEEFERAIKRIGEAVSGEELPISVNGVQGGKIPPKQAIQQIRVNQNVFSAQYDSPFGGGI